MAQFSEKSKRILATCHPKLIILCDTAIMRFDFSVISGHRGEEEQNRLFGDSKSHLTFPHSKHNKAPSMAVDLAPYFSQKPHIRWDDLQSFCLLAGYVLGLAVALKIELRWGGAWVEDFNMENQRMVDLGHFELKKRR